MDHQRVQVVDTMRLLPLFNELSVSELQSVAASVSCSRHDAGQVVFTQGEPGGDLLIVMEGSIKILTIAANGRQQLLAIERAGSSLGEVSIFDGGPYSTTAVATEPVVLLRLRGEQFRAVCSSIPTWR